MQGSRIIVLALGACLAWVATARAGIYNRVPTEQLSGPLQLSQFQRIYGHYMRVRNAATEEHLQYQEWINQLERKAKELGLLPEERLDLSAYYLRLKQPEKAVGVLAPLDTPEGRNFMVLANLSMAHFLSRRMERAIDYAEQALKAWPAEWPGMTRVQLAWFHRVETAYLSLLRLRARDELLQPGKVGQNLDLLFGSVRLAGADGRYMAGGIDPRQYTRLPADHLQVVEQLLVWMPDDQQLVWLFAELLNANGYIGDAAGLMSNLSFNQGYRPKELTEHLRVLEEARAANAAWMARMVGENEQYRLLWMAAPRGVSVGGVPVASEVANLAVVDFATRRQQPQHSGSDPRLAVRKAAPAESGSSTPRWMPDVRHVVVSFLAGVAITLLVGMQLREMRRRRQTAAVAKE